jgi:hypothetical protein
VRVLTEEECQQSINDIWDYVEQYTSKRRSNLRPADRFDPLSWHNWPEMAAEGILGEPPVWSAQALAIRQHPNVYQVFANLMNKQELFVNHDRY